jgi:hypothetical protein
MIKHYQMILLIHPLLANSLVIKGRLGTVFKEVVDALAPKFQNCPLRYCWFDFHHETKQKGKWNNLSKLVTMVDDTFRSQRFFCKLGNGTVTSYQVKRDFCSLLSSSRFIDTYLIPYFLTCLDWSNSYKLYG